MALAKRSSEEVCNRGQEGPHEVTIPLMHDPAQHGIQLVPLSMMQAVTRNSLHTDTHREAGKLQDYVLASLCKLFSCPYLTILLLP